MDGPAAVFDWDGTLRPGFTSRAWVRLLVRNRLFRLGALARLVRLDAAHSAGRLAYDDFADQAGVAYAAGSAGRSAARTRDLARSFVRRDTAVHAFVPALVELLHGRGIRVVVVSGTPQVVLDKYRRRLGLDDAYGLDVGERGGLWEPSLRANPGTRAGKAACVVDLGGVLLAAGNDEVDRPLLDAARIRFTFGPEPLPGTQAVNARTILRAVEDALTAAST